MWCQTTTNLLNLFQKVFFQVGLILIFPTKIYINFMKNELTITNTTKIYLNTATYTHPTYSEHFTCNIISYCNTRSEAWTTQNHLGDPGPCWHGCIIHITLIQNHFYPPNVLYYNTTKGFFHSWSSCSLDICYNNVTGLSVVVAHALICCAFWDAFLRTKTVQSGYSSYSSLSVSSMQFP